jgi:cation-dependent mannose-6-phosphate receptor
MYYSSFQILALYAFAMQSGLSNADSSEKAPPVPCTIHSPSSGSFYDLQPISLARPDPDNKSSKNARDESWKAKGYDYNANFTLNICAPVIEEVKDVVGINKELWQNVSAFYNMGGKTYSIG